MRKKDIVLFRTILIVLVAIILIFIGTTYYFYYKYQKSLQTNHSVPNKETQSLVSTIGQYMELPTDEVPAVATVTDINKLKNQAFFAHAKNGDKVLIYTKNKEAILWDPSSKKIVQVGPVFISVKNNQSGTSVDTKRK